MASFIECKASKVTVSGQGCGTAYIPSPRRRRRVRREEEASTKKKKKERERERESRRDQPPADRRGRYATRRGKKRIEKQKKKDGRPTGSLPSRERKRDIDSPLFGISFASANGLLKFMKRAIILGEFWIVINHHREFRPCAPTWLLSVSIDSVHDPLLLTVMYLLIAFSFFNNFCLLEN